MSKSAEKRSKRYKILIILLVIGYVITLFIDFCMFVGSGFDSYNYLKVEPPAKIIQDLIILMISMKIVM